MQKKINVFFLLISCLLFASFSPSLDGRAVVADEGVMPEGYFAKTVGYLPGDSIIVSNLASEKTLDILVVGSLDRSEGVAILLSPEAASELGIVKNSNVIVKITKRSGRLDETVSGTAVIAEADTAVLPEQSAQSAGEDHLSEENAESAFEENASEKDTGSAADETVSDFTDLSADEDEESAPSESSGSVETDEPSDAAETIEPVETSDAADDQEAEAGDADEPIAEPDDTVESIDTAESIAEAEGDDGKEKADFEKDGNGSDEGQDEIARTDEVPGGRVSDEPVVTEAENEESVSGAVAEETEDGRDGIAEAEAFSDTLESEEENAPGERIISDDAPEEISEKAEAVTEDMPDEESSLAVSEPLVTEGDDEVSERIDEETGAETEDTADESEAVSETVVAAEGEAVPDEKIIAEDVPEEERVISEVPSESIAAGSENETESRVTDEPAVTEAETGEAPAAAEKTDEETAVAESEVPAEEALSDEKIAFDAPPEEARDTANDTAQKSGEVPADEAEAFVADEPESAPSADEPYSAIVLLQDEAPENKTDGEAEVPAEVRSNEIVRAETETTEKTTSELQSSEIVRTGAESTAASENTTVAVERTIAAESSLSVSSSGGAISSAAASIAREYGARTAENLSSLDKGSYYVQIAAFSAPANIRETLAKYGRDYPVTLVPLASGGATQVMIGPLSVDEYAVVLERFKSYGYKDAFIRKIR